MGWPLTIFFIVSNVAIFWFLACNNRTCAQRRPIIAQLSEVRSDDELARWRQSFDAVPYGRHLWMLFTFRDPMKLYADWRSSERPS